MESGDRILPDWNVKIFDVKVKAQKTSDRILPDWNVKIVAIAV